MARREHNNSQGKHWCFTLNNYTDPEIVTLAAFANGNCDYFTYGKEVGEAGTPHLQGYFCLKQKKKFLTLKNLLSLPRIHIELKRGSVRQAIDYCHKDGDFIEIGIVPVEQGNAGGLANKERWIQAQSAAKKGNLDEIDAQIFITHYGNLKRIAHDNKIMPVDLNWTDPPNEWIYGGTGVGKSFRARQENPTAFLKQANKWWDRYNGEDTVIIEDLGLTHQYLGDHLKIWADKYAFPVEIKCSGDRIRPKKLVITSNYHIKDIWTDPNIVEPLLRRFKVIHITKAWNQEKVMLTNDILREKEVIVVSDDEKDMCLICYLSPCNC